MSGIFDQVINYAPPSLLTGTVTYKGTWSAATNTPTLANPPSAITNGNYYVVSAGGTQFSLVFNINDWIISNGSAWEKVDNTDSVDSVFGRTGAVVGVSTDYSVVGITNTALGASNPSTVAATTITATSTVAATGAVTGSNLSGTNTGDQTITLTGGVTGSGTGSFAATVVTNANLTGDVTSSGNATTLTNAPVIAKVLTGYTSGAGTVAATDSILQAIQKLNGNDGTNANLTGVITSSGNATSIASQTGTGTKFVVDTSPTLVTPNIGIATGTSLAAALNGTLGATTPSSVAATTGTFSSTLSASSTANIGGGTAYATGATIKPATDDYGLTLLQSNDNAVGWGLKAGTSGSLLLTRYDASAFGTPAISITAAGAVSMANGLAVTGALSSTTGANFATSSGSVGIGTASPTYKFEVQGNPSWFRNFAGTPASPTETQDWPIPALSIASYGDFTSQTMLAFTLPNDGAYFTGYAVWNFKLLQTASSTTSAGVSGMEFGGPGYLSILPDGTERARITSTGLNSTAIGATTPSTGAFTTVSSTSTTNLATAASVNVGIFNASPNSYLPGIAGVAIGPVANASVSLADTASTKYWTAYNNNGTLKWYLSAAAYSTSGATGDVLALSSTGLAVTGTLSATGATTSASYVVGAGTVVTSSITTNAANGMVIIGKTGTSTDFYLGQAGTTSSIMQVPTGTVNVVFAGSVSKGSGSFRIEHPLPSKSATHQLVHSFIEGPKCDLIYRGKVDLVDGKASVNIDTDSTMTEGTFEALCATVQCFTSNESGWGAIRGKVVGNILTIEAQDAASTDNVSWMVIGERKDKHIMDTNWTDDSGRPIVEPLKLAESALESK